MESKFKSVELKEDLTPCASINWFRKAVTCPDGSRTDIYYGIEGTDVRLGSFNGLDKYCKNNKIECNKNLFDFSIKNKQSGKISNIINLNRDELNGGS